MLFDININQIQERYNRNLVLTEEQFSSEFLNICHLCYLKKLLKIDSLLTYLARKTQSGALHKRMMIRVESEQA